ncbi:hypothetical protein CRYUN_Cryun03dG0032200 [Craigia yunnanensis]
MQRSTGTNSSAGSQACAVCKYQRRKCSPDCPLAPFFPAKHHKDFLNTRKLFGVKKIIKLIENLDPQQRAIAMKSIIFQANMRANDPVGGCYRIISDLYRQIDWKKAELDHVYQQLAFYKAQAATQQQHEQQQMVLVDDQVPTQQQPQPGQQMVQLVVDGQEFNSIDQSLKGFYDISVHEQHYQEQEGNVFQSNYGGSSSIMCLILILLKLNLSCRLFRALSDVGEDIKPLLAGFDDKGAGAFHFDSKGLIYCSDKLVLKEEAGSIQHKLKHDLKDAASLFTLTNSKEKMTLKLHN